MLPTGTANPCQCREKDHASTKTLQVDDEETYKVTCLSMGNPHCVIFVENVDEFPVEYVGPIIENHEAFPKRTNVGFVQVLSKNELKVRVWERGCGETLACGTGTCAAVAAANRLGKVGRQSYGSRAWRRLTGRCGEDAVFERRGREGF